MDNTQFDLLMQAIEKLTDTVENLRYQFNAKPGDYKTGPMWFMGDLHHDINGEECNCEVCMARKSDVAQRLCDMNKKQKEE